MRIGFRAIGIANDFFIIHRFRFLKRHFVVLSTGRRVYFAVKGIVRQAERIAHPGKSAVDPGFVTILHVERLSLGRRTRRLVQVRELRQRADKGQTDIFQVAVPVFGNEMCIRDSDNTDQEYLSQYLPDKVVPDLLFQIPGSGKDHPVQPGECFILANQGLDHTKLANSKADMSKADFEWVDAGTSLDVDVPEVPNAVTVYGYSLTINIFSVQSNRAYFIFRPTEKNWIEQLKTTIVYPSGMSEEMYPVPSKDIIDGVQLCPKGSVLNSPSLPSSVDTGYSYVGENEGDSGSYLGLCVSRKIKEKTADGRYILQDTNNSSNDFLPNQEPSPYEVKE